MARAQARAHTTGGQDMRQHDIDTMTRIVTDKWEKQCRDGHEHWYDCCCAECRLIEYFVALIQFDIV